MERECCGSETLSPNNQVLPKFSDDKLVLNYEICSDDHVMSSYVCSFVGRNMPADFLGS